MVRYQKKDITGERIGTLVAESRLPEPNRHGQYAWVWRCDCGRVRVTLPSNLRHEARKHGGRVQCLACFRQNSPIWRPMGDNGQPLPGEYPKFHRFGDWRVLRRALPKGTPGDVWVCLCLCCRTEHTVRGNDLRCRHTFRCQGCENITSLPDGEILRRDRVDLDLSLDKVSAAMGVSPQRWHQMERRATISPAWWTRAKEALNHCSREKSDATKG